MSTNLGDRQFVWMDGGQVKDAVDFWLRAAHELNFPSTTEVSTESATEIGIEGSIPLVTTASGSQLYRKSGKQTHELNSLGAVIAHLTQEKILLVIDDFHYIDEKSRTELMRNVKGAVFNGLKVI